MFTFALAPTIAKHRDDEMTRYEPFSSYLEQKLGMPVSIVRYQSYAETVDALRASEADAASLGLRAFEQAQEDGVVEPLLQIRGATTNTSTYRSVFVTRADSGVMSLEDLRGLEIALVDGQSTSGYVMPRAMLREANLDPESISTIILNSHGAVVEAVIAGDVAAGGIHENYLRPPGAEKAVDYARLRTLAKSREIPRGPIVVRSSLDTSVKRSLREALLSIHEDDPNAARMLLVDGHQFTAQGRRSAPTLKSIAALAGVSYATVSRVVNKSGYVSEELRGRIEAIIKEVGYAPNGNARVLLGRQLPLVAMVVKMSDTGTLLRIEQLRESFEEAGLPLLVVPVGDSLETSLVSQILRDRRLGAIVVFSHHVQDPVTRSLALAGLPVVSLADAPAPPGVLVTNDENVLRDVIFLVEHPHS